MTTEQDLIRCVLSILDPDVASYTLRVDAPLNDDGTVDAESLTEAIVTPALKVIARLAAHLGKERDMATDDVLEEMLWDTRFDDLASSIDPEY